MYSPWKIGLTNHGFRDRKKNAVNKYMKEIDAGDGS